MTNCNCDQLTELATKNIKQNVNLRVENKNLKSEVISLRKEVRKLKEVINTLMKS